MTAQAGDGDRFEALERLLGELDALDDSPAKGRARELVALVLDLHRDALARLMDLAPSEAVRARIDADPLLGAVLGLHDLAPSEGGLLPAARLVRRGDDASTRCELCGADVAPNHTHVADLEKNELLCACAACGTLFEQGTGRLRTASSCSRRIALSEDDARWDALDVPIQLVFIQLREGGEPRAFYPSPAGALASEIPLSAWWRSLVRDNPELGSLRPYVEALLVNRLGAERLYYRASIDVCYELVGLVRRHWRGLRGGSELWSAVAEFFARLDSAERRPVAMQGGAS